MDYLTTLRFSVSEGSGSFLQLLGGFGRCMSQVDRRGLFLPWRNALQFDEDQREVLDLCSGRHRVLAPPGSGKTELLSHRVRLAVQRGVDPGRMACLTFTNRAARVMKERIPLDCKEVFVGNFHAFGIAFLKRNGHFPLCGAVLDEEDSHQLVTESVEDTLAEYGRRHPKRIDGLPLPGNLVQLLKLWSRLRRRKVLELGNEVVEESERMLGKFADSSRRIRCGDPDLARFLDDAFQRYMSFKDKLIAIDFDDILALADHHLQIRRPDQGDVALDWLQVDEAQDLNAIQWSILDSLCGESTHLLVLGDAQQSIFSFMGSSLSRLERETAGFCSHNLRTNYRSPAYLLRFYERYARRILKTTLDISADDSSESAGDAMQLLTFEYDSHERRAIANEIVPEQIELGQRSIAILTRTNRRAMEHSSALSSAGMDHFLVFDFDLFRTRNAKDFMAFLSVLNNPDDRISWIRLLPIFAGVRTLKESRRIVNELFEAGVNPGDMLSGEIDISNWSPARLAESYRRGSPVVFDVETTGLDYACADIVQIAALKLCKGKPVDALNLYLRTDQSLAATEGIHGISAARLGREGEERRGALEKARRFFGDSPLVAHNLSFDWRMLDANLRRSGVPPIDSGSERYCTFRAARSLYPRAPRHTLASLLALLGLRGVNSHDALDDARATVSLLARLAVDARKRRRSAKTAIRDHKAVLQRLRDRLQPLLERLRARGREEIGFGEVFDLYRGHLREQVPRYEWPHEEVLRGKLIRHMDKTCSPASLEDLLAGNLYRYMIYREPDLILDEDRLVVSTVHRAKGLEFDTVILPGAVENNYPCSPAVALGNPAQIAEEARTFYVALTRPRSRLIVTEHRYRTEDWRKRYHRRTRFLAGLEKHFGCRSKMPP
jgi:DNA helicase II / ATP-dependent DNA helicase PcrA